MDKPVEKFTLFEMRFDNEKIENEFHSFFHRNNLNALFYNDHKTTHIKVSLSHAQAVTNDNGAYVKTLKDFSNVLSQAQNNLKYQHAVFKIIHDSNSLQGMINKMKIIMDYRVGTVWDEHQFNLWNIVFYNKELF